MDANPLSDWLSQSTLPGGEPPLPDDAEAASDDFITAARRAAQASAQKSILASLAPSAKSARKLNLPFMKSAAKPARDIPTGEKLPPEIKPATNKNNSKRRTLVLAGLVLLAAVTAFTFNMLNKPQKSTSTVPTAPIEGTVQPAAPAKQSNAVTPAAAPAEPVPDGKDHRLPCRRKSAMAPVPSMKFSPVPCQIQKPTQL